MKVASRSSFPHRQASAKEYLARPCGRFMPFRIEGSFQPLSALDVTAALTMLLQLWPCPQRASHPSQEHPAPTQPLSRALAARAIGSICLFLKNFILWVFIWKQKDVSAFLLVLTMRIKAGGTDIFLPLTWLHSRLNVYFWADVLIANYIWKRRQNTQLVRVDGIKAKFTGFASGVTDATLNIRSIWDLRKMFILEKKLSFAISQSYQEKFAFVTANFAIYLTLNPSIYVLLPKISIS